MREPTRYRRPRFDFSGNSRQVAFDAQRRVLRLSVMLLVVLAVMAKAGNPGNWRWLWQVTGPAPASVDVARNVQPAPATQLAAQPRWLPQVDRQKLREVEDDTVFRIQEHEIWFQLLALLRDLPEPALRQASNGPIGYLQLARQTSDYRGQLVELEGTVRRVTEMAAPANEQGITRYWQAWLFPRTAQQSPVVVYFLHWPTTASSGMSVEVEAKVLGFVFKRWPYNSGEGLVAAPVVLSKQPDIASAPRQDSPPIPFTPVGRGPWGRLLLSGIVVAGLSAVAAYAVWRGPSRSPGDRPRTSHEYITIEDRDEP